MITESTRALLASAAQHNRYVSLNPEQVEELAAFFDTLDRTGIDVTRLVGRVAWLETAMKRSHAKAAQLTQELDAACPHS